MQQGVGHRHEEEVQVHDVQEARDHAQLVDTGADTPDESRRLELRDGPPAAGSQLGQEALEPDAVAVIEVVEVVDRRLGRSVPGQAEAGSVHTPA